MKQRPHHTDLVQLVANLSKGDEAALAELYELYFDRLYAFATAFFGTSLDAKDVVQETFIKVWERRARLKATGSIEPFLLAIVKNTAIDLTRKKLRESLNRDSLKMDSSYRHESSGEEIVIVKELENKIERAIDQLPPKTKTVFSLKKKEGMSNSEIATKLNLSKKTVENHINIALSRLRQLLPGE
ncbi:MAG: RNA polymerase sigma-70 factor [Saprospiraceae bacterium]|nr:RNA polymerase sigma-70 factor [Saprospiraceae bacterium]